MTIIKELSDLGDAKLVDEEGDVLVAYRCPAGVLTISTGLTAASGVVVPVKGMTITKAESRRLRRLALAKNYEPAVVKALPTTQQNIFDGALLWHWNTGAIARASWVAAFLKGSIQTAKHSFLSWNKAGGKVLPGLQKRRNREWSIIEFGNYGDAAPAPSSLSTFTDHAQDFKALGYDTARGAEATVMAFQRANGLTPDGLIGPATRATILRALAAKKSNNATVAGGATGSVGGGSADLAVNPPSADTIDPNMLLWVGGGALAAAAVVYGITLVWRYRGPLFAWLPEPAKDWFEARGVVLGRRVRT